jgi:predicted DNA-binding protein
MRRKTTIWLDDEQMRNLERLSDATGAPKAELIRRAVDKYLAERSSEITGRNRKSSRKEGQ